MFEHVTEPLLSRLQFAWRICKALSLTILVAGLSLLTGTLGYHFLVGSDWSDSFHCACLVLGNHDVAVHPESTVGKVFVGLYVMYGGLLFVSMVAILASPVLHRIIHSLHLDSVDHEWLVIGRLDRPDAESAKLEWIVMTHLALVGAR